MSTEKAKGAWHTGSQGAYYLAVCPICNRDHFMGDHFKDRGITERLVDLELLEHKDKAHGSIEP